MARAGASFTTPRAFSVLADLGLDDILEPPRVRPTIRAGQPRLWWAASL